MEGPLLLSKFTKTISNMTSAPIQILVCIIIMSIIVIPVAIKQSEWLHLERGLFVPLKNTLNKKFRVPNIAHYTWFTSKRKVLKFHELLSMLSVHKIMKPDKIYFHHNMEPSGKYWEEVKRRISNLVLVRTEPPNSLFGLQLKKPSYETTNSDVYRVVLMQKYGGVYLDPDVLLLKSLEPLRVYPATIGLQDPRRVCGGFIMSERNSTFSYLWINAILDDYPTYYQNKSWAYFSGYIPTVLSQRFSQAGLVHVEKKRIHDPNYEHLDELIGPKIFDWHDNFAVHLWYRLWKDSKYWHNVRTIDSLTIKSMNNTFGQIARMIYHNTTENL